MMKSIFLSVMFLLSGVSAFAETNYSVSGDDANTLISILNKTKYASFVENDTLKVATTFLVGSMTCSRFQYVPAGLCSVTLEGVFGDIANSPDSVKIFDILKRAIEKNGSSSFPETSPIVAKNLICRKSLSADAIPICDVTIL